MLYVEEHGSGPPVVLAHGFAGSARNFRPQIRALADGFRVIVYDARGHARSGAPAGPGSYCLERFVADLEGIVADTGSAPVVVGGLSMGAAVALAFAFAHPERVRGLVLASFPGGRGAGAVGGVSASAFDFADALDRKGLERAGEEFVWGPRSGLEAGAAKLVRQGFLEHSPAALAAILRELLAVLPGVDELGPRLSGLDVPVLVVAGADDASSLPACRGLAAALPRARLEVIPDAGHVVNLAQPAAFNAVLRGWLEALPGA